MEKCSYCIFNFMLIQSESFRFNKEKNSLLNNFQDDLNSSETSKHYSNVINNFIMNVTNRILKP